MWFSKRPSKWIENCDSVKFQFWIGWRSAQNIQLIRPVLSRADSPPQSALTSSFSVWWPLFLGRHVSLLMIAPFALLVRMLSLSLYREFWPQLKSSFGVQLRVQNNTRLLFVLVRKGTYWTAVYKIELIIFKGLGGIGARVFVAKKPYPYLNAIWWRRCDVYRSLL